MKHLYFATANKDKLKEARNILGTNVLGFDMDVDEIQSLDPKKVAVEKARSYYSKLKKPIFVEDISLTFNALNNLPGTYINDFSKSIGNIGLIKLLSGYKNRSAFAQATISYIYKESKYKVFIGKN